MKRNVMLFLLILSMAFCVGAQAEQAQMQYPNSALFGLPGNNDGAVLMLDLPVDTVMTEFIEFEDGDYIQSFQLPYGGTVQILRYADFAMTLEELANGEWTGYTALNAMDVSGLDASIEQGIHIKAIHADENQETAYDVYLIRAQARGQVLLLQVVFPSELGSARIDEEINAMLQSIQVHSAMTMEWG